MTCNQLGGPENCNREFTAETFKEIGELSKNHGMEMFQQGDEAHLSAMEKMKHLTPEEFQEWFAERKQLFDESPTNPQ